MTAWGTRRGFGIGALVLALGGLVASPLVAAPGIPFVNPAQFDAAAAPRDAAPVARPLTPAELRAKAAAAEKAGDWEAAFSAHCELYVADRSSPAARAKLNAALRRVQQVRRHRDPAFQQYVTGLPAADAVNLFAEVTAKVPAMFVDAAKATPQHLWASGVEELDRALASPGFRAAFLETTAGDPVEAFRGKLRTTWAKRPVRDPREARTALKQLLAAAQDAVPVRVPAALAVEFVCGACSGLDEYTVFLSPGPAADHADATSDLSAYGLYLGFHADGGLYVDGVSPGSWVAFNTPQLRKGERIARVNGRTMDMMGPEMLAEALQTPVNGAHELELVVPAPGLLGMARLPTPLPTVFGDRIVNEKDGIATLRISEFQATTPQELDAALVGLKGRGMRALVLDLRGNRGGSFVAGVEVARRFLPAGLIVTTQGQLGEVAGRVFSSDSGMNALDVPLVVLIDAETASAAEVVAAALKDNGRAVLVGMPTFGKGTIQYPLKLAAADDPDGTGKPRGKSGTVRLTIARLISPRGTPINGTGISPNVIEADPTHQLHRAIEQSFELLQPMPRSPMPATFPPSY